MKQDQKISAAQLKAVAAMMQEICFPQNNPAKSKNKGIYCHFDDGFPIYQYH